MSFDFLAPHYLWIEQLVFGDSLQRCRTALLPQLKQIKRALVVGEGNGRFLAAFLAENSQVRIDCLDISSKMTDLARKRLKYLSNTIDRVRFYVGDIRIDPLPDREYDLIVTNFLLDCFTESELKAVVARLAAATTRESCWLVGDFRLPVKGAAQRRARLSLAVMYGFFRLATHLSASSLIDPLPIIESHGFKRIAERSWQQGFLSSQLWRRAELV